MINIKYRPTVLSSMSSVMKRHLFYVDKFNILVQGVGMLTLRTIQDICRPPLEERLFLARKNPIGPERRVGSYGMT